MEQTRLNHLPDFAFVFLFMHGILMVSHYDLTACLIRLKKTQGESEADQV